jgi:hypothetical protein
MKLPLEIVRLDGGTQPRAELRLDTISDYAEAMQGGAQFPPVVVFHDGTNYWLADGFHRLNAWKQAFPQNAIEADVRQGTQADAQWFSYGANKEHDKAGTRRTTNDIGRAVLAALQHPQSKALSDESIAQHVGCHRITVQRCLKRLEEPTCSSATSQRPTHRTGKDGRTINTANIGKSRKRQGSERKSRLKVHLPVRTSCPVEPLTTVNLPHNPVMGARTLLAVFPLDYVRALADELATYLAAQPSN